MYIGIVGVKSEAFASFLASNDWHVMSYDILEDYQIKDNICKDKLKCLHLFQCYMEAKSDAEMPEEISSIFTNNEITLSGMTLLPHHISSLIFFMSTSSMQWQILKLGNCNLGDVGVNSLLEHVIKIDQNLSTLEYVDLSGNYSSPWGVYCAIIRHCCVNSLTLCGDEEMINYVKEITDSLQANVMLRSLTLCKFGRIGVESVDSILAKTTNTTLKELNLSWGNNAKGTKILSTNFQPIAHNNDRVINVNILCDDECEYLPETISLSNTVINDDVVYLLSLGLYNNTTIKKLDFPHRNISINGMSRLSECIKHPIPLEYVDLSGNETSPWGVYCAVIKNCCVNSLTLYGNKGIEKCVEEITHSLHINRTLQSLTLCAGNLRMYKEMVVKASNTKWPFGILVVDGKQYFKTLDNGDRKVTSNSNDRVVNIKVLYATDCCLPETISSHYIDMNDEDTMCLITFGLCNNMTIKKFDLSHSNISVKRITRLLECIKHPISLEYVNLSGNCSSPWGVYCAIIRHRCVNSLTLCGDEGMKEYVKEITDCLQTNATLQSLTLCKIGKTGVESIESILANNTNIALKELNLSWGSHSKGTKILSTNLKLLPHSNERVINVNILYDGSCEYLPEAIICSHSRIDDNAVYLLSLGLYNNTRVKKLDLFHNYITSIGMNKLSECIKHLISLEYVDLSGNCSSPWGVYCAIIRHCCFNGLTLCGDEGMEEYVKEITDCLQTNATLQSLTLCKIGRTGVESIESILANSTNIALKELNLSWGSHSKGTKIFNRKYKPVLHNNDREININILHNIKSPCSLLRTCSNIPLCDESPNVQLPVVQLPDVQLPDVHVILFGLCVKAKELQLSLDMNGSVCVEHAIPLKQGWKRSSPWGVYCAIIRHCCGNSLTLCGDEGMEEYVKEITDCLQTNATLQSLTLCKIGRTGVESIESILANSTNIALKELNLSWGRRSKGTKILSTNLKLLPPSNERVINVNILYDGSCEYLSEAIICSHSRIDDNAVYLLSLGLYSNTRVKKLDLFHNCITSIGMNKLSECIKHLISLEYVDLSGNCSSPWGVYCAIIRHCCVNSLTLCGDEGMEEYVKGITDCLQTNATLQSLTLCKIGRTGVESIESILANSTNIALKELNLSWGSHSKGTKIFNRKYKPVLHNNDREININILHNIKSPCSLLRTCSNIPLCDESPNVQLPVVQLPDVQLPDVQLPDVQLPDVHVILFGLCVKAKELQLSLDINGSVCVEHAIPLKQGWKRSSPWGVYCAIIRHCCGNSLTLCGDEGMEEYVKEITDCLQTNATLQSLTLCKIGRTGVESIESILANSTNIALKELNLSWGSHNKGTKILSTNLKLLPHSNERVINVNILYDGSCEYLPEAIICSHSRIDDNAVYLLSLGLYNNTRVKKFDLFHNYITSIGMNKLSKSIKHSISLEYVDLSGNFSSPWGVYCAIIRHCCVNSLTLCGDEGMEEYVKEITDCLQTNATLQSLTLCKIGRTGVESIESILANSTNIALKELNLSWGRRSKGTKILSTNLKLLPPSNERVINVNILYDGSCEYLPNAIIRSYSIIDDNAVYLLSLGLYNNTRVKKLYLFHNYITSIGMNKLSECIKHPILLEYVNLSGNCSSPWGVYCAIIRHCCVNSLTLCGDEGMEEYVKEITDCLQTNATLQSLTLCKIGRTGVESIESILVNSTNIALKELNLSWGSHSKGTKIVSTNLKLLPHSNERVINVNILYDGSCEYLPEAIICSHSRIDDNAVYLLSLGLYNNTKVKKFDLFHNYITSIGMNKLSKSIKHSISLEYVDLSGNCSSPWGVYCAIIRHCCVNSLTLCGDEGMKKYVRELRDSLQSNTKLQSLTLCTSRRYKNMILVASNILVIDEKLFVDTAFNSNRNLALNCNGRVVSIKIVYADSNCEGSCIGWSTHTYCDCNQSMPDKTSDCTYDNDSDWDHLHEVDLSCCNYNSFSCNSTRFDKVKIYNNDYKCLFESIDLSHKDINDDTLCLISFGLCNSTTVQILDLSCNRITDDGAVIISDCFKGNYSLHTLILSRNRISYKGTKEIAEMIKVNKVIQKLDMSCNNISDDGAVAISESLKTNNVLQELSLSNNQITSKGAKKIAEALGANKCLHKLDISHNSICDDGIIHISNSLKENNTLQELNLSNNQITSKGAKKIAKALGANKCLHKLDISHNSICDDGIIHISNSLKENNTLQELNLSKSGVSLEGARIIAEALYTLKKFSISM